ncbi:signal peptidase I [Brevibacillus fluminis]|uniref:Signal peptidase I n=1 Tax=Brevibacillus fluminis TaxID=511487 RepID=A0A3M8DUQ5_9BACL|nr:signal peptidase I [Brevibacillus fluminis]RNB91908.1 signal peptidase I [Brevibacillus fluminis]
MSEATATSSSKGKKEAWEWIKALVIALVFAFFIRTFLFAPFIVEGESMEATLHNNERLVVNKAIYYLSKPQRGDIIVFHAEADKDYIKRVIGVAGETVEVRDDELFINGKKVDEPYLAKKREEAKAEGLPLTENFGPIQIPPNHIFVMGDNRQNSRDSRMIGPVDLGTVVGRAEFVFWPIQEGRLTR